MVNIWIEEGSGGCRLARETAAVAIVVDACRASATIVTLLDRKAAEVIAVGEVADARALARSIPNALLAGERKGVKLPGFDLGNSPLEAMDKEVAGKTIVLTTTTGSKRLVEAAGSTAILVGSPLNASGVAKLARRLARAHGRDIVVIPAGLAHGPLYYCTEDWYAAALIARRVDGAVVPECQEKFATLTANIDENGLAALFHESKHGRFLMEIGFEQDVGYCSRMDLSKVVPIVQDTLKTPNGAPAARVISAEQGQSDGSNPR